MSHHFRVALHDTDAAGVLFFGHLFRHLHDAYEDWMAALGFPIDALIRSADILLPLTHAEADYRAPMRHGERICIALALSSLEAARFTISYRCINADGILTATALTRHTCIDPGQRRSTPLPEPMARALQATAAS